jgi:ABC-type multidrug transport system ATPase subunit
MTPPSPSIHLGAGLDIGYRTTLVRLEQEITLASGTHFLLARNGRGKTTLLRTLAQALKPLAGHFQIQGCVQYLPEDLRFDPEITPKAIFRAVIPARAYGAATDLARSLELDLKRPYGRLSTGNRRKTALIIAEFSINKDRGNVLLLDEPFSGLDAFSRQTFEEIWRASAANVLRLVSCHPDYDSMVLPSTLIIEGARLSHLQGENQSWSTLKPVLN